eukprot:3908194-Alexandrium_andersonii.AAC.1
MARIWAMQRPIASSASAIMAQIFEGGRRHSKSSCRRFTGIWAVRPRAGSGGSGGRPVPATQHPQLS